RRSRMAANRPLIEPPMTRARRVRDFVNAPFPPFPSDRHLLYHRAKPHWRHVMALSMLDKKPVRSQKTGWPPAIAAEFERESKNPNGCVGQRLLSENDRVRVWEIRLKPGERFGFHRHVLDYFWSVLTDGKARAHVNDGTMVEHTYTAG